MSIQRLAALAAILLAAATVVAAVIALIVNFPRGLFVLLLAVLALAAGWQGVLHRGMVRVIGIAIAVVALAAVLVLLLSRDVVDTIIIVAAGLGAIAAARAAFTSHADLTAVDPPKHPVLFYNPKSGGGKAERFHLADEAAKRGIEAVELTCGHPARDARRRRSGARGRRPCGGRRRRHAGDRRVGGSARRNSVRVHTRGHSQPLRA